MKPTITLLCLLFLGFLSISKPVEAGQMELHAAVEAGSVAVRIEFLGGAMGDRMKLFLRNRTSGSLFITVTEGTIFEPQGGDVQRLAALRLKGKLTAQGTYQRCPVIELPDGNERGFLIEVVCIDYHKNSPPAGQQFKIAAVDVRCQRILSAQSDLTLWAYQSAIWMDRAGVTTERLQAKFKVPTADLEAAQTLLSRAEKEGVASLQQVEVSAAAKLKAEGVFSPNPATRAAAFTDIQALDESDRTKLQLLLNLNVPRGGQLPSAIELEAGSTLEELLPSGIQLPMLEVPASIDEIITMVDSLRRFANVAPAGAIRQQVWQQILEEGKTKVALVGLKSRFPLARVSAVQALSATKQAVAVEALIVALRDENQRVQNAATNGLESLTGQKFGNDQAAWTKWWQSAHDSFTAN